MIFAYTTVETAYLSERDPVLGAYISKTGMIAREVNPDVFASLVDSIVSQQISNKAADTVYRRLVALVGNITPQALYAADVAAIQQCGMTVRKAGYLKGVAEAALTGAVDFDALKTLPDAEIVKLLSSLSGVGVWTAEMLLLFSLQRPDVLSWGDLAIRRGIMALYGLTGLTKAEFELYRKRFSPYGSVASLYLWQISHEAP